MALFDIILIGVTLFILYRLYTVLGRRDFDVDPVEIQIQIKEEPAPALKEVKAEPIKEEEVPEHCRREIEAIKNYLPSFTLNYFLEGAKTAFEMVLEAYDKGDKETLKGLLSKEVYSRFADAIDARKETNLETHDTLISILSATVESVEVYGKEARITVEFNTEQMPYVIGKDGASPEGATPKIEEKTDFWSFAKNLKSKDPTWSVIATR